MCASMCHKRRDTNYNVDCPNIKNIITHPAPHQCTKGRDMNYNQPHRLRPERTIHQYAIVRTNELQPVIATRHFSQTKPRGSGAKAMKQPCAATPPPPRIATIAQSDYMPSDEPHNRTKAPRPASMYTPRGGHRYNPRPEPRRHHLTHAADMGHTSPQRRNQHKAPCIVPLPGAAAATYDHKPKPPCHVSIKDTKQGGFIFLLKQNPRQDRMDEI